MSTDNEFAFGDEVLIPWGVDAVRATIHEIYGPEGRRQVVVRVTPEPSGYVVDEPTTFVFPLSSIRRGAPTG